MNGTRLRTTAKRPASSTIAVALLLGSAASLAAQDVIWTVGADPLVEIGASAVDPADQLGFVVSADRLSTGEIVILDALLPAVRVYSAAGHHLRDIGRAGDGPGEFREPMALQIVADTMIVLDRIGRRTWFSAAGEVHRADRIVLGPFCDGDYNARPGGLLPDGSLLVRCEQRLFGRVRGEYRQIVGLLRERRSGAVDAIGWFPADSGRTDRRGVPVPRPYVPRSPLLWTAAADRIFVASADDPRVQLFTREAVQGGGFTVPAKPQAVTARHIEEDRAEALRPVRTDNDRRVVLEWMEGSPRAARTPALRALLAVSREELWIETWVRSAAGSHWLVVNGSGDPLAQVRLPVGITLLAAGGDWVMGLWRDPYGVERVRLYRLTRT